MIFLCVFCRFQFWSFEPDDEACFFTNWKYHCHFLNNDLYPTFQKEGMLTIRRRWRRRWRRLGWTRTYISCPCMHAAKAEPYYQCWAGIRNCIKPSLGIRVVLRVLHNQDSQARIFKIPDCHMQRVFSNFWGKSEQKLLVLCQFFQATWEFLNGYWRRNQSWLVLWFLYVFDTQN